MRRLALITLVACGGGHTAPPVAPVKPVEVALDPACPFAAEVTLPDGKLRCRELPFTIDFPANTKLQRQDDGHVTFYAATLDRGVLALFIEPRFGAEDDGAGLRARLEAAIKGIAPDAVITDAKAPPQETARVASALSFTTPDGGYGMVHGYLAHDWFVAAIAGGRQADTPARPDKAVGQAFLGSLVLRALPTKWEPAEPFAGIKLELPVASWEGASPQGAGTVEKGAKFYAAPTERVWIAVRDLEVAPKCALFDGITDADVPGAVRKMFGKDDLDVTGRFEKVGTKAVYAEIKTAGGTMALSLICADPRVTMVTVTGTAPAAELKAKLDHVTKYFAR